MNGALVHTWRRTVPGRETMGLDVFGRALAYYDELAKEGRIHGHSEFFTVGGDVGGMVVVTGDMDELRRIEAEETYAQILVEASLVAEGYTAQLMGGGTAEDVTEGVTNYLQTLTRLGIA